MIRRHPYMDHPVSYQELCKLSAGKLRAIVGDNPLRKPMDCKYVPQLLHCFSGGGNSTVSAVLVEDIGSTSSHLV